PRTATTTQMFALEQLGKGPCYHMRDLLADLEGGLPQWEAVREGKPDWDTMLGGCVSCVDFPTARFFEPLMEHYPDAKVLLSVRPADQWVAS
ncbi:sulfotransferase family protein, partial [Vibrio parahaemolyticus]